MPVTAADVYYMRSAMVSKDGANGGRIGTVELPYLAHNILFGYVSEEVRKVGATLYAKVFWLQKNADDLPAYDVRHIPLLPTNAGDRMYFQRGTLTDTQAEITAATNQYAKIGAGKLFADISPGATSLVVTMESNDYEFEPASKIYVYNAYMTGQTIQDGVQVGDSVAWSSGNSRWEKITKTTNYIHPNGRYIGNNVVMSYQAGTTAYDLVVLKENKWTETIGTGNGTDATRTLAALTHITNGLVLCKDYQPTITATCSGIARTVTVKPDGSCTGYCSAGQLNLATGAWTTPITWTTAPDGPATSISITYYDKNHTYSGNNATLQFGTGSSVTSTYSALNTYVSGTILGSGENKSTASSVTVNSTGGTYDSTSYPIYTYNDGTLLHDTVTITFTSSTAFTAAGNIIGDLGTGNTSADFSPINALSGQPWFTFRKLGLGGIFIAGDTLVFTIYPATCPFWIIDVIPPNTGATPVNMMYFTSIHA